MEPVPGTADNGPLAIYNPVGPGVKTAAFHKNDYDSRVGIHRTARPYIHYICIVYLEKGKR